MKREEEKAKKEEAAKIGKVLREPDHYAECYPGMTEMNDAIDDSDEEADYSKMDLVRTQISLFAKIRFFPSNQSNLCLKNHDFFVKSTDYNNNVKITFFFPSNCYNFCNLFQNS